MILFIFKKINAPLSSSHGKKQQQQQQKSVVVPTHFCKLALMLEV